MKTNSILNPVFRVRALLSFLLLCLLTQNAMALVCKEFCISGNSNGVGFSWAIIINGSNVAQGTNLVVPQGGTAADFASAFRLSIGNSVQAQLEGISVTPISGQNNCFRVCAPSDFQFWVGDAAGTPTSGCQVTNNPAGCSFNPLIMEMPSSPIVYCGNKGRGSRGSHGSGSHQKIMICHIPPSHPNKAKSKCVGPSALAAHLAHGDAMGPCPGHKKADFSEELEVGNQTEILSVYPNPSKGVFTLDYSVAANDQPAEIVIYNMEGKAVKRLSLNAVPGEVNSIQLDCFSFGTGVYTVALAQGSSVVFHRVLIAE